MYMMSFITLLFLIIIIISRFNNSKKKQKHFKVLETVDEYDSLPFESFLFLCNTDDPDIVWILERHYFDRSMDTRRICMYNLKTRFVLDDK